MTSKASDGKKHFDALYIAIVALFFISGFSSLIYQVVWTRELVFVFGSTTFASSTVLAVFMGGLALGSFIAGRYCDKMRMERALLWYGILEGVIGAWALLAPFFFESAIPIYRTIWQSMHLSVMPFSILRFSVAAAILLPPTACMGATLPLLSRFVVSSLALVGQRVGTLYAVNTFGAVVGTIGAGFYLLPVFGLSATTFISAGLNFFLAFVVCWIVWMCGPGAAGVPQADEVLEKGDSPSSAQRSPLSPASLKIAVFALAVSGAVAMVYEVAWTRALLMVVGSTTYAFSCMLASFLLGIFIGSFVASRFVDRLKNALGWFGISQIALAVAGLVVLIAFNYLPYCCYVLTLWNFHEPITALYERFLAAGFMLLPIGLLLGATFPLVITACTEDVHAIGKSVGSLYSANTLGAIIGAFLAGFVIIPQLGAQRTLIMCICANLLLGLLVLSTAYGKKYLMPITLVGVVALGITGWSLTQPGVWDYLVLLNTQSSRRGITRSDSEPGLLSYHEWNADIHAGGELVSYIDGACATVGVVKHKQGLSLLTNGHVDASSADMPTQILLSAMPLAFKPDAKDICVVGWGSGVSAGVAAAKTDTQVTAIEIEPAVIKAAESFSEMNLSPDKNERVSIELNDGRNQLLVMDKKFDIVVSEPSNPWQPGVCNLFTKEFFRSAKRCVKPDGIFSLWLQSNEVSPANVTRILAALHSVYPYILPLDARAGDMVVLASEQPFKLDKDTILTALTNPQLRQLFRQAGIYRVHDVVAHVVMTPDAVDVLVRDIEPNSDDRNRLEYEIAKIYEAISFHEPNQRMFENNMGQPWNYVQWSGATEEQKALTMAHVSTACSRLMMYHRARVWAAESIKLKPNSEGYVALARAEIARFRFGDALSLYRRALALSPKSVEVLSSFCSFSRRVGHFQDMRQSAELLHKLEPGSVAWNFALAESYMPSVRTTLDERVDEKDQPERALPYLPASLLQDEALIKRYPLALVTAAVALFETGMRQEAIANLQRYVNMVPGDLIATRLLARWYEAGGEKAKSEAFGRQADETRAELLPFMGRDVALAYGRNEFDMALFVSERVLDLGGKPPAIVLDVLNRLKAEKVPQAAELLARAKLADH